jgi:hypothetical protein
LEGERLRLAWVSRGQTHHPFGREITKALINSDEHRQWQVYHAQPRSCLRRIPRTDHGKPGAAVLELAGFRVRLDHARLSDSRVDGSLPCAFMPAASATFLLRPACPFNQFTLVQRGGSCPFRCSARFAKPLTRRDGRVAEWFKAPVLKTGVPARVPWVRIPPLPPVYCSPLFALVRNSQQNQ